MMSNVQPSAIKSSTSQAFWEDKRVIVTGGAGFLGSYVVKKLKERHAAEVIIPRIEEYDLCDLHAIRRLFADVLAKPLASDLPPAASQPSNLIIIHLAAKVGGIGANREHPADFFYDNLMMGSQLMHEAWRAGVGKFVAIGTICAYPKFTPIPFKEEDLWDGYPEETNAPYGLAKKMLLVQAQAYRQQYGFNAIYLLPVNLYGPGDNFDPKSSHVIPAQIRKFIEAQESGQNQVVMWGDGSPTREFLYVEDAAEGILLAAEHYNGPDPVNLGSGMEISIKQLSETIAHLTGYQGEVIWDTSFPNGQPRRALDVSRAEKFFGFRAQMRFEEGLKRTIEEYRKRRGAGK
jgi:GDP-L-fucose synthase